MASPTRTSGRSVNLAQLVTMFLAFLLVAGVGGVLTAGFAMPMVGALGATTEAGYRLFNDLDTEIGDLTLSERSELEYADGSHMATFYVQDRIVVTGDEISDHMKNAIVAIEDKRFYEHGAIDPEGLLRAAVSTLTGGGLQGGSTLTQQYVKNVLMEQARVAGDYVAEYEAQATTIGRKLREMKLAIALEQRFSKDEILVGYLNVAPFGPSQYGVEAAAQYFFSKSAADLNAGEAALLAGVTQAPTTWNPITNPENAFQRRNVVLRAMFDQSYISQEQYDKFREISIEDMLDVQHTPPRCSTAEKSAYFCDYVVRTLLQSEEFGETANERYNLLTRGGLTIRTTLVPDLQEAGYEALTNAVPVDDESGVSNALSTVEPGTGHVLAMVQNTPFGTGEEDGAAERTTTVNFNVDGAVGGSLGFQTGSTFKAFVLAAWLEAGNSLYDVVDASQGQSFPVSSWNYSGCESFASKYDPKNIDGIGTGPMRVIDTTIDSVNTAFAYMANQINMCDLYDLTQRLGVHVGSGTHAESGLPLYPSPSMVLGSNNVAPLTMAAAFAAFAANGKYCTPVAIESIVDTDGEEVAAPTAKCSQALDPEIAATVTYALEQVVDSPRSGATGRQARIPGFPVAGKTGTANNDYAAWFIGFTPDIATAVWNGFSEAQKPMLNITINGRYWPQVYGGAFAAPIWQDYTTDAIDILDLSPQQFPEPDDELVFGDRQWVPDVSGMSIDQATQTLHSYGFQVRESDREEHEDIPEGSVIRTWPASGSLETQDSMIALVVSSGPPPDDDDDDDRRDDRDRDDRNDRDNRDDHGHGNGNGNGNRDD